MTTWQHQHVCYTEIVRGKPTDASTKQRALELLNATKSLEYTESVIDALDAKIIFDLVKRGRNPILEMVLGMLREEYETTRKSRTAV